MNTLDKDLIMTTGAWSSSPKRDILRSRSKSELGKAGAKMKCGG